MMQVRAFNDIRAVCSMMQPRVLNDAGGRVPQCTRPCASMMQEAVCLNDAGQCAR